MKNINFIPVLIYILISISCKNEVIKVDIKQRFENNIKYANGFDIITKNANFGYKRAEEISNLVLANINSDTTITLSNGFTSSALSVQSVRNLDGLNPLDNVFRTIITYNIIITQN